MLDIAKPLLQRIVAEVPCLTGSPAGTISVQCDLSPVRACEAFSSSCELVVVEPTGRTPRLPLNSSEADWVFAYRFRAGLGTQKPLIPEASRLLEGRNFEFTTRLKGQSQSSDGDHAFGEKSRQGVGHPRPPIVPHNGKALEVQSICQIHSVLG